jgi:hypothetical protein
MLALRVIALLASFYVGQTGIFSIVNETRRAASSESVVAR